LSIFEFTPEDLKANQGGYLTDKQRGWLQGTARGITSCSMASAPIALGFVLLGLGITLALYLSNEDSRRALFSSPMNLLGLAAAGVIGVARGGVFDRASAQAGCRREAGAAPARTGQGPARSGLFSPQRPHHISCLRGDHRFSFGDDMSSVFREGHSYNVYYCQSGPYQLIMSLRRTGRLAWS